MNYFTLTEAQLAELDQLNKDGTPNLQLTPVRLDDGRHVLNADLLGDCSAGGTWAHYRYFLESLTSEWVHPDDFKPAELPSHQLRSLA